MSRLLWLSPLFLIAACAHKATPAVETPVSPGPAKAGDQARADTKATTNASNRTEVPGPSSCGPLTVHFAFDSDLIGDADGATLQHGADCLRQAKNLHLVIEGNADERGTEEYNLALGDRRALAVEKYLRALGVPEDRMRTISYGEEKPVCSEHDEGCWMKNRRAEIGPSAKTTSPAS